MAAKTKTREGICLDTSCAYDSFSFTFFALAGERGALGNLQSRSDPKPTRLNNKSVNPSTSRGYAGGPRVLETLILILVGLVVGPT